MNTVYYSFDGLAAQDPGVADALLMVLAPAGTPEYVKQWVRNESLDPEPINMEVYKTPPPVVVPANTEPIRLATDSNSPEGWAFNKLPNGAWVGNCYEYQSPMPVVWSPIEKRWLDGEGDDYDLVNRWLFDYEDASECEYCANADMEEAYKEAKSHA